jgi:hypothetical protein
MAVLPTPAEAPEAPLRSRRAILLRAIPWVPIVALMAFLAARIPLITPEGVIRGWNSDSAIIGLMGKKLLEGRGFDIFFWGQNYLGPLTSIVTAGWGAVFRAAGIEPSVGPLALRLAGMTTVGSGIVIFWWGLARRSRAAAAVVAFALAVGPAGFYRISVVPLGTDMSFLFGAILFAMAATHLSAPAGSGILDTVAGRGWFGLLAGIGWWMNATVGFMIGSILLVLLLRAPWYPAVRSRLRLHDRLLFRAEQLDWRQISRPARALLIGIETLLLLLLLSFILHHLVSRAIPVLFFSNPLLEPVISLLVLHAALDLSLARRRGRLSLDPVRRVAPFAAGFAAGYAPVWIGRIVPLYPEGHSFGLRFNYPDTFLRAIGAFPLEGAAPWLGIELDRYGVVAAAGAAGILLYLALHYRREIADFLLLRPRDYGVIGVAAVASAMGIGVFVLTQYGWDDVRYLIGVLPAGYAVLAWGGVDAFRSGDRGRSVRRAAVALVAVGFVVSQVRGSSGYAAAVRAEPDPRPVISRLHDEGCAVTYAGFWDAYKLRFISAESLRFVPVESRDRTPDDTRRYESLPGRKCHLRYDGTITDYEGAPRARSR